MKLADQKTRLIILVNILMLTIGFVVGQHVTGQQFKRLIDSQPFYMSVFFYAGCITGGGEPAYCKEKQKETYDDIIEISNNLDAAIEQLNRKR